MTTEAFRAALSKLGLTQCEAARRLGISERTVRRYANGYRPIKLHIALALSLIELEQAK